MAQSLDSLVGLDAGVHGMGIEICPGYGSVEMKAGKSNPKITNREVDEMTNGNDRVVSAHAPAGLLDGIGEKYCFFSNAFIYPWPMARYIYE